MKKLWIFPILALSFACSNESEQPRCSSDLSAIQISGNTVYTGEIITFSNPTVCPSHKLTVSVNDTEVDLTVSDFGEVSFAVPAISGTSATVKIQAGETIVSKGPFTVIKAYGTWKPVASFPDAGRVFMDNVATSTDGYLFGGASYNSNTGDFGYYNDLYKYNAESNVWTKITSSDNFKQSSQALVENKIYLPGKTYSVVDNTFTPISNMLYKGIGFGYWATQYFTNKGNVYIVSDINQSILEIQKYDPVANKWSVVKEIPYTDNGEANYFSFNFAVEHNGVTYIGILFLNRSGIELWAFDGADNSLTKMGSVANDIGGSTRDLKHMFTLNDLAYFMERGESSVDNNGKVSIIKTRDYFHVYNFATNEWRKIKTEYPQTMYGANSLNIGNRGFAGMGAKEGTTWFIYSQQFFEFVPAK